MGRKRKSKFEKLYREADSFFVMNDGDRDLTPIRISLPKPPSRLDLIDGYGLHPDDQFFRRFEIPPKLLSLEKKIYREAKEDHQKKQLGITGFRLMSKYWDEIDSNQKYYKEEIEFIRKVWWHRLYGYWFYNDGKPTYITGRHFTYLNFWYVETIDGKYPEYRDRNRREWLFREYLRTCTETFKYIHTKTGEALPNEDGEYEMVDVGTRLFYGDIQPKSRRSGASNQGAHEVVEGIMTMMGGNGTIVSKDGSSASKIYDDMILPAFSRMPFFLRPAWDGSLRPNNLLFRMPSREVYEYELGGKITVTESADEIKNDGDKLYEAMFDESGKGGLSDVMERWNVNKMAMSVGNGSTIIGYCTNPSTVEDMDEGGLMYKRLNDLSNFYVRYRGSGQTLSGLARVFLPAHDGLEGFIDRFGMSVINTPTERQIELSPKAVFAKIRKGSYQYLQEERDTLLNIGTDESKKTYRSIRRKQPMRYSECWMGTSGDLGMPIEKIDERAAELRRSAQTVKGNFDWVNGERDGFVDFIPDEFGRFEVSLKLANNETNLKEQELIYDVYSQDEAYHWKPKTIGRFTASSDTFDFASKSVAKLRESNTRLSDGGFSIFWEHDRSHKNGIDDHYRYQEWESCRFVCTYRYRPETLDEFNEDCLKACVYYGAMLYPENNKANTIEYFIKRGYGAYLMYDIDEKGQLKSKPGFTSLEKSKEDLFNYLRDHFNRRCHKECHLDLLEEVKNITGPEYMKNFDLLAAAGGCLLGSRSRMKQVKDRLGDVTKNSGFDIPKSLISTIRWNTRIR